MAFKKPNGFKKGQILNKMALKCQILDKMAFKKAKYLIKWLLKKAKYVVH